MTQETGKFFLLLILIITGLTACKHSSWNSPHTPSEYGANVAYGSFSEPPKTLDPALAYSSEETAIIAQIYEPPLQYHYLKRPYTLVPLTVMQMPEVIYYDAKGQQLPNIAPTDKVAYTTYKIRIKPGVYYQPHPALATDKYGNYLYLHLAQKDLASVNQLSDFQQTGTRELTADDYVYEIKRLASPKLSSPILGLMNKYIVGLKEYTSTLQKAYTQQVTTKSANSFFDLRDFPLAGAKTIDRYTYEIIIYGKYPQFIYWLAMPFFAPIPWEADKFYSQPGMAENDITFDWYPIGTGPYMLTENNPNRAMVLERNPNFHGELYPNEGEAGDLENGYLADAGKPIPFIDKVVFNLEKESIPRWNKFLQGYYDTSAISSDSYDQTIVVDEKGKLQLTPSMVAKGIRLQTSIMPSIYYFGFNMLDDVVGGYSESAQKIRQAISIAIDIEQYIAIFLNGRGIPAQGLIPPGIFGYVTGEMGIDPYVYNWKNGQPQRKSIEVAKQLLAEAGYPNGRNVKTGAPLVLNYDVPATTAPDDKARFDWMREQFAKLGIQLNIRATQYNRFQEKMRMGNSQIYFWSWLADYPDPENFLFLLYSPDGKVKYSGENTSNYQNAEYDRLFEQMKLLPDGPGRQKIIDQMVAIARKDAPWIWGIHLKEFELTHQWLYPMKPNAMAHNTLKYQKINPALRVQKQKEWNQPK